MSKNIGIACDHAAFEMKEFLKTELSKIGYIIEDFGTSSSESVDYPDFIHPMAKSIQQSKNELGIVLCGSGNGASIAANKNKGIRSAICWNEELAKQARNHNNANVLSLAARFLANDYALIIAKTFLNAEFEGGRHQRRINKIENL